MGDREPVIHSHEPITSEEATRYMASMVETLRIKYLPSHPSGFFTKTVGSRFFFNMFSRSEASLQIKFRSPEGKHMYELNYEETIEDGRAEGRLTKMVGVSDNARITEADLGDIIQANLELQEELESN
jgi:hypothetical protein